MNSAKWLVDFYKKLNLLLEDLFLLSKNFYKMFLFFIYTNKRYKLKLNNVMSNLVINSLMSLKFKLMPINLDPSLVNKLNIFLIIINLSLSFFENFLKFCMNFSYSNVFFNVFLLKYKKMHFQFLIENEEKNELTIEERMKLRNQVFFLDQQIYYLTHRRLFFLLHFILVTKYNFDLLFEYKAGINSFYIQKFYIKFYIHLIEFCKQWLRDGLTNLKSIFAFLNQMLGLTLFAFKRVFLLSIFKNIDEKFKFYVIYLALLKYKNEYEFSEANENSLMLFDQVDISNAFLNKWFYYRYMHNFIDKNYCYTNKTLNLSLSELNLLNLAVVKQKGLSFNKKLEFYFKTQSNKSEHLSLTNFFARKFLVRDKKNFYNFEKENNQKYLQTYLKRKIRHKLRISKFYRYNYLYYAKTFKKFLLRRRKFIKKFKSPSRATIFRYKRVLRKKKFMKYTNKFFKKNKYSYLNIYQPHWIKNYHLKRSKMWMFNFAFDSENTLKAGGRIVRQKFFRFFRANKNFFYDSSKYKAPSRRLIYQNYRVELKNRRFKKNLFLNDSHFVNIFLVLYKINTKLMNQSAKTTSNLFYNFWFYKKI